MRLLLDTNILLDVILTGRPGNATSTRILNLCEVGTHQGLVAWQTLPTVSYYHRKGHTTRERWGMLRDLPVFIEVRLASLPSQRFWSSERVGMRGLVGRLRFACIAGGMVFPPLL